MDASEVAWRLIDKGLISKSDVVGGGLEIEVRQHRNQTVFVTTAGRGIVVKCPRPDEPSGLANEAAAYEALGDRRRSPGLTDHLPAFLGYDDERSTVYLEYLRDAETLRERHTRPGRASLVTGRQLGRILALLHARGCPGGWGAHSSRPWPLQLLHPPLEILWVEGAATLELIRRIQAARLLRELIEAMSSVWVADALCHNDLRLDNILYTPRRSRPVLTLVDWELCRAGWSAWDVACVMASYVELWAVLASNRTPRTMAGWQPLLRGMVEEYVHTSGDRAAPDAITVSRLVAVRLLQSALEYSQRSRQITRESVVLLELATSFARQPLACWVHILGLPWGAPDGEIDLASALGAAPERG